jgi:hypothetical protein
MAMAMAMRLWVWCGCGVMQASPCKCCTATVWLWLCGCVVQSFKSGNENSIHGALLVIGELLRNTGEFMLGRFKEVCDTVLLYRDHKDKLVKDAVIRLLPQLAAFEPEAFVRGYLDICLKHIIETLKTNPSKGNTFIALGQMAIVRRFPSLHPPSSPLLPFACAEWCVNCAVRCCAVL